MLHVLLLGTQVRISFTHQVQGSHTQHIFPSPVQVSWSIALHLIYRCIFRTEHLVPSAPVEFSGVHSPEPR